MVSELIQDRDLFSAVDRSTDVLVERHHNRLNLSDELRQELMSETLAGKPFDPLLDKRKFKKQEIVARAYKVPHTSGGHAIIFETDDGEFWQLCEVGLGWTTFDSAQADWQELSEITAFLPAAVQPRPDSIGPWCYDLALGNKAIMSIRLDTASGKIKWSVKPKRHPSRRSTN